MPYSYTIDPDQHMVFTTAEGILSEADVLAFRAQLQRDPLFDPTFRHLCDFSQTTKLDLSAEVIWSVAQVGIFAPTTRRAFVVGRPVDVGLVRMFAILRELAGDASVDVFEEYTVALAWLNTP